jgi:pyruvate-ferredoxin/flavodoxin oxidoreductase
MPDLTGRALRLTRRLLAPRPPAGEVDPGIAVALAGADAIARVEATLDETSLAGATSPDPRGSLAAATGRSLAGLRATAFASGSDLAPRALAQAAAWGAPLVVHHAADGDHGAYHAAADAGAFQLFAANAEEAVDFALIARHAAEAALLPAVVAMDVETALGVEDLHLPSRELLARYLGDPGDTVHPATPAQEMLYGRHRRLLPRRHDAERPLRIGGPLGPEAHALAGASRRAFVAPHLAPLLAEAFAAFAKQTGREHAALSAHRTDGAHLILLAQGSAIETVEAVADHLRAGGVKVGVVGLRVLRPFPAAELAEALRGVRGVAVLERIDAPLAIEPPLAAEVRSALGRAGAETPPLTSVLYGLGGFSLRAADLAALVRDLDARLGKGGRRGAGADPAPLASPLYLGFETPPAASPYPKRGAFLDALRQSYPEAARLGFRAAGPALDVRPEHTLMVAVHRLAGGGGDGLAGEAGSLLHRLAGGHLRSRRDRATAWGTPCVDRLLHGAHGSDTVRDPGDGVAADVALWHRPVTHPPAAADVAPQLAALRPGGALIVETPGDRSAELEVWWRPLPETLREAVRAGRLRLFATPAAGASAEPPLLREDRLLGALLGTLAADARLTTSLRKLRQARRDNLAEAADAPEAGSGTATVEARLDALQSGFEQVRRIDPAHFAAVSARRAGEADPADEVGVPAAVRRSAKADDAVDNLPHFWDCTGLLYRHGETAELAPDPALAVAAVPPLTAALRDHSPARALLPLFDPAKCTGCGACWSACPDAAIAPVVTGAGALLDYGMARARERGHAADALRMVAGKLATGVGEELTAHGGGAAGPLFDAALDRLLERSPLPAERKAGVREAWGAVREEIAALPLAHTAVWGADLFALAVNADACKGCGLCVAECAPEALTAAADSRQRSREARALWRLADELPAPSQAAIERARTHRDIGPLAAALATAEGRRVMVGGHGAEAGSGEAVALRQALGAAAAALRPDHDRLLAELGDLEGKLAAAIHDGLAGSLPGADLEALSRGLDGVDRPDVDLASLAGRIETAFDSGRVDVLRLRRLVAAARALADLRWRLERGEGGQGRAPFAVALGAGSAAAWAGAFPDNPFAVPVTVDAAGDPAGLARGLLAGQIAGALDGIRALRRARLELDTPAEAERAAEELAGLGWEDLTAEERRFCPPLFLVLDEAELTGAALGGLLELLASALPVRVLTLADGRAPRLDLGLAAGAVSPAASVAQTSIAHPTHLAGAVAVALAAEGPALVRIYAPTPTRGGFSADQTLARAREAVDSGAWTLSAAPASEAPAEELAEQPDSAVLAAAVAAHQAEQTALRAGYEARLAALAGEIRRDTAQRVRARLLALATRPAAPPAPSPEADASGNGAGEAPR